MPNRLTPILAIAALAATLWVVPSMGSQGMGTIGERFGHADRSLVDGAAGPDRVSAALRAADAHVEAALAH